jgi:hypothetical protein
MESVLLPFKEYRYLGRLHSESEGQKSKVLNGMNREGRDEILMRHSAPIDIIDITVPIVPGFLDFVSRHQIPACLDP